MQILIVDRIKKAAVSQHDANDCGAACILSILRYYGSDENLEELKKVSGTTKNGTTLLGLQEAFSKHGIESEGYLTDIKHLREANNPVILHVNIDNYYNHYIVCYGYENGCFHIVDPLIGYVIKEEKELQEIWKSKKLLTTKVSNKFSRKKNPPMQLGYSN